MARVDADFEKGVLKITTLLREKDLAKMVPGSRWSRDEQVWTAPLSWGTAWAVRAVFGKQLDISDELRDWIRDMHTRYIEPALAIKEQDDVDLPQEWAQTLYPFQRVGVAFLAKAQRVLLADEMGTGKTVQTISALRLIADAYAEARSVGLPDTPPDAPLPALIVCPNSMKYTWAREIEKWWPEVRVEVLSGPAGWRRELIRRVKDGEADILIANWEILRQHSRLSGYGSIHLSDAEKTDKELNEIQWAAVVADEAHRGKNPQAKQTRALWQLRKTANYRFALTGTPISNHPGDLWALLHFLDEKDWPSKTKYIDLYCLLAWTPWGNMDIVDLNPATREIFDRIFEPHYIRRTKKVVLPQLPDKSYTTRYVELTSRQKTAYEQLRKQMLAELDDDTIGVVTSPLVKSMRLLQLSSAFAETQDDDPKKWKLKKPSNKVDALMELVEEMGDQQLAVFAESRQLIELAGAELEGAGISLGYITGSVGPQEREQFVNMFQERNLQVLLLTLGAGGEGITLTAADTVVFMQRSWSLVKNKQAEDRVHRIGQLADKVSIIDLVSVGTLEEYRLEKLDNKAAKLESLVRDEQAFREMLERRP